MHSNPFRLTSSDDSRLPRWLDRPAAWIERHSIALLVVAGLLQLGLLAGMVAVHAAPLLVGETILLKTVPVDPRDIFRGDYVILDYEISRLPSNRIEGMRTAARTDYSGRSPELEDTTVYVVLEPEADGRHYRAVRATVNKPTGQKYIKGLYRQRWGSPRIAFGIEAYYVPEGSGVVYEQAARQNTLSAEVSLAPWGQATLRSLKIEPERARPR